jgi:hypothetical protein
VKELDEMRCALSGRKPLVLLHQCFSEARSLAMLCRAGVLQQQAACDQPGQQIHEGWGSGPTLVFVEGKENRARARIAADALLATGAWHHASRGRVGADRGGRKCCVGDAVAETGEAE